MVVVIKPSPFPHYFLIPQRLINKVKKKLPIYTKSDFLPQTIPHSILSAFSNIVSIQP